MAGTAIFTVLLLALTYVQFFAARSLEAHPWNNRSLYEQFGADRGAILVDGEPKAYSEPSDDDFEYQRVYADPLAYGHLTGYFSLVYGATGLEAAWARSSRAPPTSSSTTGWSRCSPATSPGVRRSS
jgi:peptidoglycan glycosyltransferase